MIEDKDITPKNTKGQPHGYWEQYYGNDTLAIKCVFINGKLNGFSEYYWSDGKLTIKRYYL